MSTANKPTCAILHTQGGYDGKQSLTPFAGISDQSAGAQGICMQLLTIPPGLRAPAHLHERHETAIYVLEGQVEMWYGEELQDYMHAAAGDYVYIPANLPHLPANSSQTEPCRFLMARTDPAEQESARPLPELETMRLERPEVRP